jgi:murein DD-endopeptidase MepM/ murein hydrolase activator NlpD
MPYKHSGFTLIDPFPVPRPDTKFGWHGGADYAAREGTAVPVEYAGKVFRSGPIYGYGPAVVVESRAPDGTKFYALYGHLGPGSLPAPGTPVEAGDILGTIGGRLYQ